MIGTTNKCAIETCAGVGFESNCANLILNHGWYGLLFDGDANNVAVGRNFFASNPRTSSKPPKCVQAWITKDNINGLISENGIKGEIDLLTIDVDGNDYWIWDAIECVQPRVVVVECQANNWGADRAVTMPYQEDFVWDLSHGSGEVYCGASLPAFVNLGKKKGYRLVGVERHGFNAFFIRNDIRSGVLPERSAEECLNESFKTFARMPASPAFYEKPWLDV